MNAQPQQTQIMSSPTAHQINQSPHHYGVPTENGTTSEDSDGECETRVSCIYVWLNMFYLHKNLISLVDINFQGIDRHSFLNENFLFFISLFFK